MIDFIIIILSLMKCPGCATSFKEGERLVLEGLHIEYKNYNLPIR